MAGLDVSSLAYVMVGLWFGIGIGTVGSWLANINHHGGTRAGVIVTLLFGPLLLGLAIHNTWRLRRAGV